MFGMGMPEILLILALALIVIGPKKLPEIAKAMGRAMGEFKRATNDLKSSINLDEPIDITPDSTDQPYEAIVSSEEKEAMNQGDGKPVDNADDDGAEQEPSEGKKENE